MTTEIIYIAGMGRSGSTLLGRVLGAADGATNLGEAAAYWTHSSMRDRRIPCSCGQAADDCPFWKVWAAAPPFDADWSGALSLRRRLSPGWRSTVSEVGSRLSRFYTDVAERTGSEVLIDASKHAAIAHAVARASDLRTHIIHLVRDPRGVAASRNQAKAYLESFSSTYVAGRWDAVNLVAGRLRSLPRYHLVRYEDFTARPGPIVDQLLADTALSGKSPVGEDRLVRTGEEHALAGNPDKLDGGTIEIRPASTPPPNLTVTVATAPLLRRYGYRIGTTE